MNVIDVTSQISSFFLSKKRTVKGVVFTFTSADFADVCSPFSRIKCYFEFLFVPAPNV